MISALATASTTDHVARLALADWYEEQGDLRAHAMRTCGMQFARLPSGLYMGVYAVTQGEYEKIMGKNPSRFSADGGGKDKVTGLDTSRFPVENATWYDAVAFCEKLTATADGITYRLPTEAEWEHACRAGTTTEFAFGDSLSSVQANFDGNYPYGGADKGPYLGRTCQVGSYEPNTWGLYDMHGNVWEWCGNLYAEGMTARVVRGGSWDISCQYCRAAYRNWNVPGIRYNDVGLRVCFRLD